jgi:hypothetical protein
MNPYCMFDLADLASATALGALSRSHAAGPASTSLVSDATTCPTRKKLRLLQQPVLAPILAELAFAVMTIADVLGTDAILFQVTILAGLAALSRSTKISLVTSSASFCSLAYNSGGYSLVGPMDVLSSLTRRPLLMMRKNAPGWTCTKRIATRWTTTFLPTTCRVVKLLLLCSRLLYLTCLKQLPLTPTHLVRTIP